MRNVTLTAVALATVAIANAGGTGAPFYYAGAPRFSSLTFQVDH